MLDFRHGVRSAQVIMTLCSAQQSESIAIMRLVHRSISLFLPSLAHLCHLALSGLWMFRFSLKTSNFLRFPGQKLPKNTGTGCSLEPKELLGASLCALCAICACTLCNMKRNRGKILISDQCVLWCGPGHERGLAFLLMRPTDT